MKIYIRLREIYRWFFRELPLLLISIKNFSKRLVPNLGLPVFKFPAAGLLSVKRLDLKNYYWLRLYPEPSTPRKFENSRITKPYRLFASRRFTGYSTLRVIGKSDGAAACLLRLDKVEDETNYYHFHYDVLGKLKVLDDAGIESNIPLLVSPELYNSKLFQSAFKRGTLARRSWVCDEKSGVTFDRMIVSTPPPVGAELIKSVLQYVGAPAADLSSTRRIYLFRKPPAQRRAVNSPEILDIAKRYDFELLDPAGMSYEEQMSHFSQARYLIIEHGAAVTNIMFRAGAPISVLEIYPTSKINPSGFWICNSIGGQHAGLVCEIAQDGERSPVGLENYYVDPACFEDSVRQMLQK